MLKFRNRNSTFKPISLHTIITSSSSLPNFLENLTYLLHLLHYPLIIQISKSNDRVKHTMDIWEWVLPLHQFIHLTILLRLYMSKVTVWMTMMMMMTDQRHSIVTIITNVKKTSSTRYMCIKLAGVFCVKKLNNS